MFLVVRLYEGLHSWGLCAGGHLGETPTRTHAQTRTHFAHDITAYRGAGRNVTEKGEALWRRGKGDGRGGKGGEEEEEKAWPGKSPALPLSGTGRAEAGLKQTGRE